MQGPIPGPNEQSVYRAIELQGKGRLADAARLYAQSLARGTLPFECFYSLGVIAANEGASAVAIALFEAALKIRPDSGLCEHAISLIEAKLNRPLESNPSTGRANIQPELLIPDQNQVSLGVNNYCTYFDSNYAPRGLAMIDSLLRNDPNARIFVLCLDSETALILRQRHRQIIPIELNELCSNDQELSAARANRSTIEWYFTATSAFCFYLLNNHLTNADAVTYLDADLYFYHAPDVLHQESVGSCAQVIEHRFAPHLESLIRYGRFNVGWIRFTNNDKGLKLLADYRKDCIEWCYDRLEGVLFADQKYLDFWPDLYRTLCVSKHIGANVAAWNVGAYDISFDESNRPYVNNTALLFYHFHGIGRDAQGFYYVKGNPALSASLNILYSSYIELLKRYESELESQYTIAFKELRYANST